MTRWEGAPWIPASALWQPALYESCRVGFHDKSSPSGWVSGELIGRGRNMRCPLGEEPQDGALCTCPLAGAGPVAARLSEAMWLSRQLMGWSVVRALLRAERGCCQLVSESMSGQASVMPWCGLRHPLAGPAHLAPRPGREASGPLCSAARELLRSCPPGFLPTDAGFKPALWGDSAGVCVHACASPDPQSMGCGGSRQQPADSAPGGAPMESSSSRDRSGYPTSPAPAFGVSGSHIVCVWCQPPSAGN